MKIKIKGIIFILSIINLSYSGVLRSPHEFMVTPNHQSVKNEHKESFIKTPLIITIKFYQNFLSPIKGENCPMYPSCSEYGLLSIKKYGILGPLKTIDRLNRCGHDVHLYERIIINNNIKYLDLIEVKDDK